MKHTVSGRPFPNVSGNDNAKIPPTNETDPNNSNGSGL